MFDEVGATFAITRLEADLEEQKKLKALYREVAALPEATFKSGEYINTYKRWFDMSEEERESRLKQADESLLYYIKAKEEYAFTAAKKPIKQDLHSRRSMHKRRKR